MHYMHTSAYLGCGEGLVLILPVERLHVLGANTVRSRLDKCFCIVAKVDQAVHFVCAGGCCKRKVWLCFTVGGAGHFLRLGLT